MSRIKNLYTYLITHRRGDPDLEGWLEDYIAFSSDVKKVSEALNRGQQITENAIYKGTSFESKGWYDFARHLLFDKANGIASRGQSTLSWDNFEQFIKVSEFLVALSELIKNPTKENLEQYARAWDSTREKIGAKRNPLLVNRTLAACTMSGSSTVNVPDFESVYNWLTREGFFEDQPAAEWYDKNVQVMEFLRSSFADELKKGDTSEQLLSIFLWYLFKNISNPFSLKKQIIKYGAPGTGKTYTALRGAQLLFEVWKEEFGKETSFRNEAHCEVVQFHPSFGYEDFMEGLRPILDQKGTAQLKLQNGVVKRFCQRAAVWEKDVYLIPVHGPNLARKWESLRIQDLQPYRAHLSAEHWGYIFSQAHFDKKDDDAVPPFFFLIDEINRAELSRVLGELMICLEYRGIEGAVATQYSALNTQETGMLSIADGYKFFIPHNVYLIGTMNTIDRSVESFDLALRRRFRWERTEPDMDALRYYLKQRDEKLSNDSRRWEGLVDDLAGLNESIRRTEILGEDYQIGHAYLMNLSYPETLSNSEVREKIWDDSIKPLLE